MGSSLITFKSEKFDCINGRPFDKLSSDLDKFIRPYCSTFYIKTTATSMSIYFLQEALIIFVLSDKYQLYVKTLKNVEFDPIKKTLMFAPTTSITDNKLLVLKLNYAFDSINAYCHKQRQGQGQGLNCIYKSCTNLVNIKYNGNIYSPDQYGVAKYNHGICDTHLGDVECVVCNLTITESDDAFMPSCSFLVNPHWVHVQCFLETSKVSGNVICPLCRGQNGFKEGVTTDYIKKLLDLNAVYCHAGVTEDLIDMNNYYTYLNKYTVYRIDNGEVTNMKCFNLFTPTLELDLGLSRISSHKHQHLKQNVSRAIATACKMDVIAILRKINSGYSTPCCVIAGGATTSYLFGSNNKDIDIFIYGDFQRQTYDKIATDFIKLYIDEIKERDDNIFSIIKSQNAITIYSPYNKSVQIILRAYKTLSEILHGFDISSCAYAFDGNTIWTTSLGLFTYKTSYTR